MKSQSIALNLLSFKSQNKDKGSDIKKDSFDRVLNEVRNAINNNTKNIKTSINNREIKNTNHTTQEQAKDDVNNSKKTESEYKLNTSDAKEKEINNKFENKKDIIEDENKKNNLVRTYDALVELLNLLNLINLNALKDTNQNNIDFISLNDLEISLKDVTKNLESIKSKLDLELTSNIDFNNQDILKIDSELKEIINHFSILFDFKNLTINKEDLQNLKNILANNFNNNSFNENNSINFDLDNENVENSATLDELIVKILKVTDKLQKVLDDNNQNPQKIDATINSTVNKTTNVIININIANTNDSLFTLLNNETSDESQRKNSNESINNQSNFSNIIQISNKINLQNLKETQISQIQKTDIIQKVADNIKIAVAKDLANVSISLKPESLGKIVIELTKDANGLIKGNIIVQSNEVKEVVSSSLNNLVSMLKDQGINISGLNVGLNQQSQNQNSFMQKKYKPTKQIETTPVNIDSIFYGIEEGYFSMKA
ncbi:flagellar hook-length control protein FliK [Caldicellulosiruptoraceae bacterium PP1]